MIESNAPVETTEAPPSRPPCPAPADLRKAIADFDAHAEVGHYAGPRHALTYRIIGQGVPLILSPGLASTYRGYALLLNRLAGRFKTVIYDYPGDNPGDGARLGRVTHDHLVDDLFGLIDHLGFGRTFLVGMSFGSTITLKALAREPRRFPKAAVQGAFVRRSFTAAERIALRLGRFMPGRTARLPFRDAVLRYNTQSHFPDVISDRWAVYVEQNGLTPVAALAHRLDLTARLDLTGTLPLVKSEVMILQGNEDRIVPRRHFEELRAALPSSQAVVMPMVGHQPHFTHAEALADALTEWFLPCAPGGCPNEPKP